jgi:hypothetical protein
MDGAGHVGDSAGGKRNGSIGKGLLGVRGG